MDRQLYRKELEKSVMKVVHLPRRAGKTTQAIMQAAETGAYIVTVNRDEARRIAEQAKKLELNIKFPITFEELLRDKLRGSFFKSVIIDNVDMFLQRHVCQNVKLEMITLDKYEDESEED